MKLTTKPRYALRMMLDLARSAGTELPVSLSSVAGNEQISRGYLEQVAAALRHAQLLRGRCGKGGGYRLSREPEEINLREVIEAVIGPINIVECVANPRVCSRSASCECRSIYLLINERITEALGSFTLADLLDPERVRKLSAEAAAADAKAGRPRRGASQAVHHTARHVTDAGGCPGG